MSTLIVILLVMGILLLSGLLTESLPKQYLQRTCQGFAWRRQFPEASKDSIRAFLILFTDAFAFKEKHMLKFDPKDQVLQIYRGIYPSALTPDALELETLGLELRKTYGVELRSVWHEKITLEELFSMAMPPN